MLCSPLICSHTISLLCYLFLLSSVQVVHYLTDLALTYAAAVFSTCWSLEKKIFNYYHLRFQWFLIDFNSFEESFSLSLSLSLSYYIVCSEAPVSLCGFFVVGIYWELTIFFYVIQKNSLQTYWNPLKFHSFISIFRKITENAPQFQSKTRETMQEIIFIHSPLQVHVTFPPHTLYVCC